MPYAIRKVPRVDGYRVVNTETGQAHSRDALPWDAARRQLRALYRAANEKAPRIRRAPPARHARVAAHFETRVSGGTRHPLSGELPTSRHDLTDDDLARVMEIVRRSLSQAQWHKEAWPENPDWAMQEQKYAQQLQHLREVMQLRRWEARGPTLALRHALGKDESIPAQTAPASAAAAADEDAPTAKRPRMEGMGEPGTLEEHPHGGADEERAPPAAPRGRARAPPPPWISRPPRPPPRRRVVPVPAPAAPVAAPVVAAAVLEDDDLMNEAGAVPLHDMVFARNPVTGAWGFVQGPPQPRPRSPSPTGVRDMPYEYW
jgi:hypothetical protein